MCPGLFAAGECAAGINGANRLGGNSLSDLLVFGKRAGEFAAKFAKENSHGKIDNDKIDMYAREALKPFENSRGENPYSVQRDLQEVMQHNVGIVRDESEMRSALDHLKTVLGTRRACRRHRQSRFQSRLAHSAGSEKFAYGF